MSEIVPIDPAITIRAETLLADPDTCKFTVSQTVYPGGPFFFDNKERAAGSPLVERLFALADVAHVLVTYPPDLYLGSRARSEKSTIPLLEKLARPFGVPASDLLVNPE